MAEKLSRAEVALAEDTLDALAAVDRLSEPAAAKASPSALYAYATDPDYDADEHLREQLRTDAALQADFQRLLNNTSLYFMPRLAAASTGAIEAREAQGCRIAFRPSRADENQVYAIIELVDKQAVPRLLVIRLADGATERLALPPFQDGRAQLLLDRNSPEAKGLMNINAEVYLK
jgi:hypothetical protein